MSVLDRARLLTEEHRASVSAAAAMDVEDDTEWVNDVYTQLNGTPARNVSTRWERLNKYRLFIGVLSVVLMGLGAALAVPRSGCVSSLLPSTKIDCSSVTTLSFVVAGLLCLTGLLGCLAWYKELRLPMSCCLAVLFVSYAVLCGASVAFVVYSRLHQLDNLATGWRQLVAGGSPLVCDIQKTLTCSGFAPGQCCKEMRLPEDDATPPAIPSLFGGSPVCFLRAANGTTYDPHNRSEVAWPGEMCLPSCGEGNNKTAAVCEVPLRGMVENYFFHFVIVLSALTVLFGILGGLTVAGMLWQPTIDSRMAHRF